MSATTAKLNQMRKITEDLVDTYCTRVTAISELVTEAYEMMDKHKEAREKVREELREALAVKNSLRRKDFDTLMYETLRPHFVRERQMKESLHCFLEAQKVLSARLKNALQIGSLSEVRNIKQEIECEIDQIKQLVVTFHRRQASLLQRLKSLLEKGPQLNVVEFKESMAQIREGFVSAEKLIDAT